MKTNYLLKGLLTLVVSGIMNTFLYAQVNAYSFSSSAGTYTPITGGTVYGNTTTDDQRFVDPAVPLGGAITTGVGLPIGFNFTYNGIVFDRLSINNNGWISLGQSSLTPSVNNASASGYTAISSTSTATPTLLRNRIAGFARDLQGQAGSELRMETIGVSPNQVCVIQWTNYRKFAATGDNYNFQIRLYETTNIVEIVYGTMTNNATAATPQIGLSGTTNTDFNNRTTTTNWAATTAGAVNTATVTLSATVFPLSGQTFTWTPPAVCSGAPVAGTTASSANPVCSGVNFTLSLSGAVTASGLTYQWQSSTDGTTYSNITGGTTANFSTNQTVSSYYQAVVTCTASGLTSTSTPLQITMNPTINCYCTPTNSGSACITNVTIGSINNTTPGCSATNYSLQGATTTLFQASNVNFTLSTDVSAITSVWFDWNQNGIYEASEWYQGYTTGTTGTISVAVPLTAVLGNTGMRVRSRLSANTNGATDACTAMGSGETEDYIITIAAATPCSGTPSPGAVQSTAASVCSGVSFTLSMSTPPSGLAGITYQWQSSPDGVTYTNIAGATNVTYTSSQSASTYYQVIVTCTNSAQADTATALQVTMSPFSNCYCTSSANNTADEEIFGVTVNGSTNAYNCTTVAPGPGSILNRYSNFTTLPPLTTITQGSTISFSVQENECDGATFFSFGTSIWIDYNQNGLFTDAGEQVFVETATAVGPRNVTGTFNVPVGAVLGNTRMRITVAEGLSGAALTPCMTYGYGETEDYLVTIVSLPANPPTPVQDPATPTCSAGTDLTVPGTPAAGTAWYWQTSANGTSTGNLVSGAYTVYLNGTYYVRTYNATYNVWSAGSDSVVVSNIPLAPTPPSPTAAASPACQSTTISIVSPPSGTAYFWQGTNSNGASSAQNASVPSTVTSSGTYYVAAYDSLTSCWSNTNNVAVVIDSYVPSSPFVSNDSVIICEGMSSALLNAVAPNSDSVIVSFGLNLQSPGTPVSFNVTVPSIPAGATITNTQLQIFGATAINGSFRSEIRVALSGATTLGATQLSTLGSGGLITPNPVITVPNLPLAGGAVTLTLTETFNDGGATIDATFTQIRLIIRYTLPASTISWWDASTTGTLQGSGSPFQAIGTTHLPSGNTPGTYVFYAEANSGSCPSTRTPVSVIINPLPITTLTDTAVCATPYVIDAQNSGSTYLWNTSETTQTISATAAGMYYVTITTANGCSANDSMNLVVNSPPIVNLGADVAFCTGDSILLDAANTGFTFLWNDLTTNQTLTTDASGNFYVTVTNPMTMCAATDSILVTVNALPAINLGVDTAICIGDSLVLDAGNPGASYAWSNATSGQTITVNTPATYFVFVTDPVTTCYSSDTIVITQNILPVVAIGADTAICNGDVLTLDAGYPGSSYIWNDSSTAQTLDVTTAGNYSVLLVDVNGCKGTDSINVAINAVPVVDLGSDTIQCAGTVQLDAGNAGSMFMWNNSSTSQTIAATSTGTYYVAVTNSNACTTVDSIDVTINPLPVLDLGNDTTICGGSLVLDAGSPGFTHLWYNTTTGQTLTIFSTSTVSVTVTNPVTGCVNMDTIAVTFNQYPLVNLGPDTAQCAGSITLNPGNNPGAIYVWNTAATTQTINVTSTGTYIVNVDNNGCIKSDTVMVTINPIPFVGFPAIAPICLQGGAINLTGTPSGGTFTGDSAVSAGMFDPLVAGLGSHPVVYSITDVNGCSNSTTQMINVADCTGIDELEELSNVNVYPNPTNGMFAISFINANFSQLNIIITDIQGKEVFNFIDKNVVGDYIKEVSLEGIAKGIYYIRLNSAEDVKIKKLIIN